jgi:Ca-activated chloride channel family protein
MIPALTGLLCAAALMAQDGPRIRVEVNLVNVAVSVRDTRGRLVHDLVKEDFQLFEDGAEQPVRFFARQLDLPLTVGLVVDYSGSQSDFFKQHRRDIERFLKSALGPRDRVFLVAFGNKLRLISEFTNSVDALMASVGEFDKAHGSFPNIGPDLRRTGGTAFHDAVYHSAEKLAGEEGRKALLVFSDGEDNSSAYHVLDAIESAQNAGVLVYGMRYAEDGRKKESSRKVYGRRVMDRLALETGGQSFDATRSDLRTIFSQIESELRSLYELAFAPGRPERDGRFRRLDVKMNQPGLAARAKPGYFAR